MTFPRKNKFDENVFGSSQINKTVQCKGGVSDVEEKAVSLLKSFVSLSTQAEKNDKDIFFFEKGRYSRIGMIFIHFSILLILTGGLIGAIWGFNGQMNIIEGEVANVITLFDRSGVKKLGFDVHCDSFKVDFYKTGQPKEYRTDLTILEKGKPIISKAIRVNHPLIYKGLKFCQATYGIANAGNFRIIARNNKSNTETVLTLKMMKKVSLPNSGSSFAIAKFSANNRVFGPAVLGVLIEPGEKHDIFWLFKDNEQLKSDFSFIFKDFDRRYYSGIQVSRDPGVPLVWAGCILILIGFIMSFFLIHTRVWLRILDVKDGCEVKIAASTSKNRKSFEEKLEKFAMKLQSLS